MERGAALKQLKRFSVPQDHPFLMHVGDDLWYKNMPGLVEIFHYFSVKNPGYNLVLVNKFMRPSTKHLINKYALRDKIHFLSSISNIELNAVYALSSGLVFPSIYEGLGAPVVEAQAAGLPVFANDIIALKETAGDGAVYFNANNTMEAADIITNNIGRVKSVVERGYKNAERFDEQKMADKYIELYKHLAIGG